MGLIMSVKAISSISTNALNVSADLSAPVSVIPHLKGKDEVSFSSNNQNEASVKKGFWGRLSKFEKGFIIVDVIAMLALLLTDLKK